MDDDLGFNLCIVPTTCCMVIILDELNDLVKKLADWFSSLEFLKLANYYKQFIKDFM